MVDIMVASILVAAGVTAVTRRVGLDDPRPTMQIPSTPTGMPMIHDADLPCPWCMAQTRENDDRCPTCGQRFG